MTASAAPRHVAVYLSARALGSRERVFLALIRQLLEAGSRVDVLAAGPLPWLRDKLPDGARLVAFINGLPRTDQPNRFRERYARFAGEKNTPL